MPSADGIVDLTRLRREIKERVDKRALRNARLRNELQVLDETLIEEEPPMEE